MTSQKVAPSFGHDDVERPAERSPWVTRVIALFRRTPSVVRGVLAANDTGRNENGRFPTTALFTDDTTLRGRSGQMRDQAMKCQHCEKPATFHITELTGPELLELHLCEDHARQYLTPTESDPMDIPAALSETLTKQLKIGQTAEELARLDQRVCPICGITFFEFRNLGRLGCPHDYTCFDAELEPLIVNIHGATRHVGKHPKRNTGDSDWQTNLIRLRRELHEAIEEERYERASELRDEIRRTEELAAKGKRP